MKLKQQLQEEEETQVLEAEEQENPVDSSPMFSFFLLLDLYVFVCGYVSFFVLIIKNVFCSLAEVTIEEDQEKVISDDLGKSGSCKKKRTRIEDLYDNDEAKCSVMERADEVLENVADEYPSFIKCMLPSNVTHGFWLVHIVRVYGLDEVDAALCLLNLVTHAKRTYSNKNCQTRKKSKKCVEPLLLDIHRKDIKTTGLATNQYETNSDDFGSEVLEGSEISDHRANESSYSQNPILHDHLLKGTKCSKKGQTGGREKLDYSTERLDAETEALDVNANSA
ncbi:hypothetical protein TEA_026436 [Camellia sinensis var. sinensis]|uniref:Uncharacterized protein n=1 Tax=Camellia sinensis var. sinensis TaxID=542762 RepID=A0A4S4DT10_CAMSN|nr:hypothetical protein TEA_026436 [Camellia sinensis var. sinensis]